MYRAKLVFLTFAVWQMICFASGAVAQAQNATSVHPKQLVFSATPSAKGVSFQYDSNGYISAVIDNSGKILESHAYDSTGRGLTSSRAGGAESITVSYPQPRLMAGTSSSRDSAATTSVACHL